MNTVVILCEKKETVGKVYSEKWFTEAERVFGYRPKIYGENDVFSSKEELSSAEYAFSTWGMLRLSKEQIKECLPSLKYVFYAAGSVQSFARPYLECGIRISSAWAANAVPVAETALAEILLANKSYFKATEVIGKGGYRGSSAVRSYYTGNYDSTVGIIGAGMIGSTLIGLLHNFKLSVKVFDPYLSDDRAAELGCRKCSLEELFATCSVVSNHLADNEHTRGMLNYTLFSSMLPYATFINTGRGAQVVEEDLVKVLVERPDLTAVLDVTHPEPPRVDHPFYSLDNCVITPHLAGSFGNECFRMAEYMMDEYRLYTSGKKPQYEVTPDMLDTMA